MVTTQASQPDDEFLLALGRVVFLGARVEEVAYQCAELLGRPRRGKPVTAAIKACAEKLSDDGPPPWCSPEFTVDRFTAWKRQALDALERRNRAVHARYVNQVIPGAGPSGPLRAQDSRRGLFTSDYGGRSRALSVTDLDALAVKLESARLEGMRLVLGLLAQVEGGFHIVIQWNTFDGPGYPLFWPWQIQSARAQNPYSNGSDSSG